MLQNPDGFFNEWLAAYRGRSISGLGNLTLWSITRTVAALAKPLLEISIADGSPPSPNFVAPRAWEKIFGTDLFSFLIKAISAEDFFDELWVCLMIFSLATAYDNPWADLGGRHDDHHGSYISVHSIRQQMCPAAASCNSQRTR